MKVLLVHNYYQIPGGEDTVVTNEKKLLEEHGNEVFLYTRDNSEIKKLTGVKKLVLAAAALFNPRTYKEIKYIIKKENIDIVHVHNTFSLISPSVYYAAMNLDIPIVQTLHNFRMLCPAATFYRNGHICEECLNNGLRQSVKYGCYRDNRYLTFICALNLKLHRNIGIYYKINYICLTEFNRSKLLQLNNLPESNRKQIVNPAKIYVKPNFTYSVTNKSEIVETDKYFIYAGRLDETKGIKILLEAWRLMGKNSPRLIVCGSGPMEEWCRRFISEHQLVQVTLLGFIPNTQVRQKIAEALALIIPTKWYEGFPMTVVEAFVMGTPVIGPDQGNVGSLIKDGINGITFMYNSAESLAEAVRILQAAPIYINEDEKNAFSHAENYKTLMEIYRNIMEEQPHG